MTTFPDDSSEPSPGASKDAWGLAGLLAVAAALRAFAWHQTAVIFNDGPVFLAMAEAILEGRWEEIFAHPYHPLYPALVAISSLSGIGLETAGVAVSVAGGLMSILAVFFFVRRAFGREYAWLAGWTVALHPWAVDFSSDVMSDGLYAGFYLLGFAALATLLDRPRPGIAAACGLATGLAYLVRPEGIGLIVVAAMLFAYRAFVRPDDRGRALGAFLAIGVVAAIVMAPLLLSLAKQSGELVLTRKKSLSALATGAPQTGLESAMRSWAQSRADAADDEDGELTIPFPRSSERADGGGAHKPPRSALGFLEAASRAGRTSLAALRYEVALFVLIGLWSLRTGWRPLREATLGVPVVVYTSVLVLLVWGAGYVARRHALAALLPLVGYAALGWKVVYLAGAEAITRTRPAGVDPLKRPTAICLGLVLMLSVVWGPRDLRPRRDERSAVRAAAEWLAEKDLAHPEVAAQKLRVAYYARANFVPLPSGNEGPIEATLRAQRVRWVVIDERRLEDHLGLAEGVGTWLRLAHSVERSGQRALVLEMPPKPAL